MSIQTHSPSLKMTKNLFNENRQKMLILTTYLDLLHHKNSVSTVHTGSYSNTKLIYILIFDKMSNIYSIPKQIYLVLQKNQF